MGHRTIGILLTPSRLEVVVLQGGRAERGVVTTLDPASWDTARSAHLRPLDAALDASVSAVNGHGLAATVLHAGTDAMVQVFSLPGRRNDARDGALLALGEQFGMALGAHPHAMSYLGRDREGERVQSHFIGCADTDDGARMVTEWASRAGLRVTRVAPLEAGTLASLARRAIGSNETGVRVCLRLGEEGSALEASESGSLRTLRPVDVDMGVLVDALTRPMHAAGDGAAVTLTHAQARELLLRVGVPERDAVIDADHGLRGADMLPLLQPVLQRCVVQVRQTLRFGLDENSRHHARLRVEGPGARIPGLAALIGEETGLPLEAAGERGASVDAPGDPEGDLMTALASLPTDVNLTPMSVSARRREARLKRMLAAGVGIAVLGVGADAALTEAAYRGTRAQIRAVSESASEATALLESRRAFERRRAGLSAVKDAARTVLGGGVSWSALLHEIALATPPEIKIVEVTTRRDAAGPVFSVRAYLLSDDARAPDARRIGAYLNEIARSPLCASVSMGETQRSKMESRGALQFSATIRGRELPLMALAGEEEGS